MVQRNLKMHKSSVADEGEYIVQVITNALWCLTNHHLTINDAAKTYRDARNQAECDSHANALVNIITKPIFHSDVHWQQFKEEVECLAKCLVHYKIKHTKSQTHRHDQLNPPRTVGNDNSVEFRAKTPFVYDKYKLFDEEVKSCDFLKPILFDESVHLASPFENRMQMKRFFDELSLSVDVDLYRYCPGGDVSTIMSANAAHIQPVRVIAQIHNTLPEYHTRAMKREFRPKISLIAKIQPGILDFVYKELALAASVSSNPEMQQRIKLISLGETEEVVENVTAADKRRHGVAHLSHWISLGDLISQAAEKCPEGTLVPSKSLVRLQFTPRNPYTHAALNFTSRIPVQYKIQKRQLRVQHLDQHYCAAQFKYFKSKAIELGPDAIMLCCDDKAKVPVGDPGVFVSTGVRGKKTLAPVSESLEALDHDMTKSSLCPSVYLECEIPLDIEKSFVRGQVNVVVNDSVFQTSGPFRHAAIMCTILAKRDRYREYFCVFQTVAQINATLCLLNVLQSASLKR
ncbi:LOW QUALITY PROTEIN: hypothetical protein MAR_006284 [Mya arenaria]|uniref:Uncharacterized protein n=1 Tax=Mya arenaria TaxID=6604 RepID=A0ABY7D948_MYAAR|nr:LOW QUALITY PROTEIN: hypothetical protein MAR_006284 [Mya arenaria]